MTRGIGKESPGPFSLFTQLLSSEEEGRKEGRKKKKKKKKDKNKNKNNKKKNENEEEKRLKEYNKAKQRGLSEKEL